MPACFIGVRLSIPQICRHFQCVSASVLNYDCDVERQCHGHGVSRAAASARKECEVCKFCCNGQYFCVRSSGSFVTRTLDS